MSSTRSDSRFADINTVFISVLRMLGNTLHFSELSEHLLLYYAGRKSFFHLYSETEKYSFFENQPKFFIINSIGYVSCIENKIIMAFRRFLKGSGPQHFLKLTDYICVANPYFRESSSFEKLKFFEDHAQYFSVQNNEYVELSKMSTIMFKMFSDKQETGLLNFFIHNLESCGPMHFFWLVDCMRNSVYNVDEPRLEYLLWRFFNEQRHKFIISDGAFVDLAPHLKSKVKTDSVVLWKEDEVIGFFIAKLAVHDCLLYTVLLKMLQNSTLDIKCFFAKSTLKDVQGFFKKHSNIFVVCGKHISLLCNSSVDGCLTFYGTAYPVEDVNEVVFFFLDCLKVKCPAQVNDLSQMLEVSNIETDFKYAFLKSSDQMKYSFFESYQNIFYIGHLFTHSCVSLHSLYEIADVEKHIIQHLVEQLQKVSTKNFWTLINCAGVSSKKFENYFTSFSPLNKFCFLRKFPTVFNVSSDGYVSCLIDHFKFFEVEAEMVDILIKQLKSVQPMYFKTLCLSAENSSTVLRKFFQPYVLSQKYGFFKTRPNRFSINSDGLVSIPSISRSRKRKSKSIVPQNVSKPDNFGVKEIHESIILISDSGPDVQNSNLSGHSTIDSNVKEDNVKNTAQFSFRGDAVHTKKLCSDIVDLAEPKTDPELMLRTLNHSKEDVNDSSILTIESSISTKFSCNQSSDADEEMYRRDQVIKSLIGILKSHTQIHFEKLCSYNEHCDEEFVNFFSSYSMQEKYNFFKNNNNYFSMDTNGYVSIPDNFRNIDFSSSANNLRLDKNTNKSTSTAPSIQNVAKQVENNTVKLQSTNIAQKPSQCINSLSCATSNAKAALNKDSFLSGSHITGPHDLSNANQSLKEDDIIAMLTRHLNAHKRMHFSKLCKAGNNYFTMYSDSQKYRFFKHNSHHFCIEGDGYVTLPCGTGVNCRSNGSIQRIKAPVSKKPPMLPNVTKIKERDKVLAILMNMLSNEKAIHIDKLYNCSNETVTIYFKSIPATERIQFFKSRRNRKKFSISPQGYVSLSKDLTISKKRSVSPCTNQISKSNVNTANSISTKDATVNNFNVTGDKTFTHQHKRQKLRNRSDSVSNSKMSGNDFSTETNTSMSNSTVPCNQQTSSDIQTCKSGINCKAVLGLQKEQSGPIRQYKAFLKSFFLDHEQEIIGTLLDRLKTITCGDFLELLQSCEELNSAVNIFFCSFSIDEKLNFFMSYPQYFRVDNNLISISNAMQSYLKASEELIDCAVCSNIHDNATVQFECAGNIHDPGKEGHLVSSNEMGLNASAQVNSAEETVEKTQSSFMDTHQYNASRLLVSHRREVIETLLAVLKIGKRLYFQKLCKSSEELNGVCKHFFHFLSSTQRLEFLKSYPQYFFIDGDSFVSLSGTTQCFTSLFLPHTEPSKSNTCSNNHITNNQSRDIVNHNDVAVVEQGTTSLHSENSSNYNLLRNSTKVNSCLLPSTDSSANEVIPLDSNVKELLNFYQAILRSSNILHFEELFAKLEDSNQFANCRTSVKKSSMLEFFEDYPDIFTIHPKGFISLVPEAGSKSTEIKVSSIKKE